MRSSLGLALIPFFVLGSLVGPEPAMAGQAAAKRPEPVNLSAAYTAYLNRLRGKMVGVWDFPEGKNRVVLTAAVGADGSVSDITLVSTPKSDAAEQAANAAFAQAQPLEPLPAGSPPVKVTFTFESTYDRHGDSSSNLSGRLDPIQPKLEPATQPAQQGQ